MRRILVVALFLLFSTQATRSQQTGDVQQTSARIAGSILVGGHAMDYERGLADAIGGRLTGSPAYQRVADFALDRGGRVIILRP